MFCVYFIPEETRNSKNEWTIYEAMRRGILYFHLSRWWTFHNSLIFSNISQSRTMICWNLMLKKCLKVLNDSVSNCYLTLHILRYLTKFTEELLKLNINQNEKSFFKSHTTYIIWFTSRNKDSATLPLLTTL